MGRLPQVRSRAALSAVTPKLTPKRTDAHGIGGRGRTEILRNCAPASMRVHVPTVRNQQVIGSSPIAGSKFLSGTRDSTMAGGR